MWKGHEEWISKQREEALRLRDEATDWAESPPSETAELLNLLGDGACVHGELFTCERLCGVVWFATSGWSPLTEEERLITLYFRVKSTPRFARAATAIRRSARYADVGQPVSTANDRRSRDDGDPEAGSPVPGPDSPIEPPK